MNIHTQPYQILPSPVRKIWCIEQAFLMMKVSDKRVKILPWI
jgi:hypothetical protein